MSNKKPKLNDWAIIISFLVITTLASLIALVAI